MGYEAERQDCLTRAIAAENEENYAEMSYNMSMVAYLTVALEITFNDEERRLYRVAHYNYLNILRERLRECESGSAVENLDDDETQLLLSYRRFSAGDIESICEGICSIWRARNKHGELITRHIQSRKLPPVESQVIPLILRTGLHRLQVFKSCLEGGELRFEGRTLTELQPIACGELQDLLVHDVSTFCRYLKEVKSFREQLSETTEFLKKRLNLLRAQLTKKPLHIWLVRREKELKSLLSPMYNLIAWTWHITLHFLEIKEGVIRKTDAITVSTISDVGNVKDLRNAELFDGAVVFDSGISCEEMADLILSALEAFSEDKIIVP